MLLLDLCLDLLIFYSLSRIIFMSRFFADCALRPPRISIRMTALLLFLFVSRIFIGNCPGLSLSFLGRV